jgi:fatty-acyl-CoA synthase
MSWDRKTTLGMLPAQMAATKPDAIALEFGRHSWTFAELSLDVDRVAKALLHLGIQPGERCIVWLNNCPQWIQLMFALAKIGAVLVPINTRLRTADLEYVLRQSEASTLITHDQHGPVDYLAMVREIVYANECTIEGDVNSTRLPALRRLILSANEQHHGALSWNAFLGGAAQVDDASLAQRANATSLDDMLFIMYTSGTTGFPKGVMRNHHLLENHCERIAVLGTSSSDIVLNYLPLFHIFGYVDGPLMSVLVGNKQILMDKFDAPAVLRIIEQSRVTQIQGFEAHLNDLIAAQQSTPADLSSLRTGVFAAGMQSAVEITRLARRVLAPLRHITAYGMTEIGANCSLSRIDSTHEQACETSGLPCAGFDFKIVDPDTGTELPCGAAGELWVKTYNVMQGYYQAPELSAAAFSSDAWFKTGDMGLMRSDGYFRLLGRYKDMLKIGGENVDPMEVERHLLNHPEVYQAAVVGLADTRLAEVAVAFVISVPNSSLSGDALIEFCRGKIASFKIPRHIAIVETLPMTASGKVRKVELRELAEQKFPPSNPALAPKH